MGIFNPFSNLGAISKGWDNLTDLIWGAYAAPSAQENKTPDPVPEPVPVVTPDPVPEPVPDVPFFSPDNSKNNESAIKNWNDSVEQTIKKDVDTIKTTVVDGWNKATDWAEDSWNTVTKPITGFWSKWKVPIIAGAGALAAIKILK